MPPNQTRSTWRRSIRRKLALKRSTSTSQCCKVSCRAGLRSAKSIKRRLNKLHKNKEQTCHHKGVSGQSPVDLAPTDVVHNEEFPPLQMTGHWTPLGSAHMYNTGNTAEIRLSLDRPPAILSGGPLKDEFEFAQLHFHWGPSNCHGAEHSLNGKLFSMEAHAVHFNKKYDSIENCLDKRDGLVVVGYFLKVVGDDRTVDHPQFAKITNELHHVVEPNTQAELPHDALAWMKQGRCLCSGYYTYHGSLTTPPYNECVTWILFPDPIRITKRQAELFRNMKSHSGGCITANFRPVQGLNGRRVLYAMIDDRICVTRGSEAGNKQSGQSPINLEEENAVGIQLPPLVMSGHWNQDGSTWLVNTGTTARITLGSDRLPATIRGGPLGEDVYQLDEVVFRWGASDCMGAEHTLNGTWFTMEAQAIHWNLRYGSIKNCWDKKDGIAICAYLLQVYHLPPWYEHPLFIKITDNLPDVIQPEVSVKIAPNALAWMRQACQTLGYYTYQGSITTSPYHECVTWIVFPEPVRISEHQAKMFRTLRNKYGSSIRENHRPVQQLNGRRIYYAS
ncbi:uncharacterized protein LOC105687851 [Athalia rosae]|uniref:uncharacterized protein LOC105687851 n=1 Tax=Athalia rosae TaxID=37344 RepID=UPI0020346BFE|nr:uncharacterized protein LOC105687851 [Athalia rosae]